MLLRIEHQSEAPGDVTVVQRSGASRDGARVQPSGARSDGAGAQRFRVGRLRGADLRFAPAVELPSPSEEPVAHCAEPLTERLHWYLEHYLDYPFPPRTEQARAVERALDAWGRRVHEALFGAGQVRDLLDDAKRAGGALAIQISSDDPLVLSWPWEALCDPERGVWANHARIERRLNHDFEDAAPLSRSLPRDRINILLVTARPYENDVRYRSITRPLGGAAQRRRAARARAPASSPHLRRPAQAPARAPEPLSHPAFRRARGLRSGGGRWQRRQRRRRRQRQRRRRGQRQRRRQRLRRQLRRRRRLRRRRHWAGARSGPLVRGAEGRLVFEDAGQKPEAISARKLSELLREHAVPVVVLSACQSALLDQGASDPFASVAAALLKAGTRSVVAMSYAVAVSATLKSCRRFAASSLGAVRSPRRRARGARSSSVTNAASTAWAGWARPPGQGLGPVAQ